MTTKNTGSFAQFSRNYSAGLTTLNGGSLTAPTNTGLVAVAGPDGMEIWELAAIATATQTSANTLQFYVSKDFGTSFSLLPIVNTFAAAAAASTAINIPMPNGVPMGPTNPLVLGGNPGAFTHSMSLSQLTENALWFVSQYQTAGTANAQTLAQCYNTAGTAYTQAQKNVIDFVAGLTNSGAMTLAVQGGTAQSVTTPTGGALTGNEVTKGFRYRIIDTGSTYILLPTDRLYAAMTQSQACTITAWGRDA